MDFCCVIRDVFFGGFNVGFCDLSTGGYVNYMWLLQINYRWIIVVNLQVDF